MKLSDVLIIFLVLNCNTLAHLERDDNPCKYATKCDVYNTAERLVHIQCTTGNSGECKCMDDNDDPQDLTTCDSKINKASTVVPETTKEQTAEICENSETSGDPVACKFWKYRINTNTLDIYFISDANCKFPDDTCSPPNCYGGGVGCEEDHSEEPAVKEVCKTDGDNYHTSEIKDNWLHWSCTGPDNEPINFVRDKDQIPHGTSCTAIHECSRFPEPSNAAEADINHYDLKYKCVEGNWEYFWSGDDYDSIVIADGTNVPDVAVGKLLEPKCNADPLKMQTKIFNQEGMLITCSDGDGKVDSDTPTIVNIPAENECLLLCNMYPTLKFFVDWRDYTDEVTIKKGERVWYYQPYDSKDDPIELITTDTTDCSTDINTCPPNHVDKVLRCWAPPDESGLSGIFSKLYHSLFE